jgi:hypothetical protein
MKFAYLVLVFLLSIASCRPELDAESSFYYAEDFALMHYSALDDTIHGSMFWINRKDSTQIIGIKHMNLLHFNSFLNGVDEGYFIFTGCVANNQLIITRYEKESKNSVDSIVFISISQKTYDSILKKTLAPPQLETLEKDTTIDNYRFELVVEKWNPETNYGASLLKIRDVKSNELIQTIKSDNFHFNKYVSFDYIDMNFDKLKDLVFFNGFNGGYMSETFDYYLYDKKEEKFALNEQLSEIAGCLGIKVDSLNRRIIGYYKSGCCQHEQKAYIFQHDSFVEVKSLEIDELNKKIISKNKINEKWKTHIISIEGELDQYIVDSLYKAF